MAAAPEARERRVARAHGTPGSRLPMRSLGQRRRSTAEGLTAFDARKPSDREDAVAKTLGVSLELLHRRRASALRRARDLPRRRRTSRSQTVELLWSRTAGLDEFDTEDLCTRLFDLSLLLEPRSRHAPHPPARRDPRLPARPSRRIACLRSMPSWSKPTARAVRTAGIRGRTTAISSSICPTTLPKPGGRTSAARCCSTTSGCARKLEVAGVNRLIEDLEPLRDDAEARKLAGALRLSAHVLNHQPRQLAGQLLGRLSSADGPAIGALLGAARTGADRPSLVPLRRSLTPPGGPLLATLEGHGAGVRAVAVTPDGRRAVSGSDDRTLKVWDLEQGALLATLEGHGAGVTAVAVTPDGRRAVSGSDDRTLKVWDLEQGALLATLEGHGDWVTAVAVTPDGRRAVSGSDDRTLKVWDLEQGALLATLEGHGARVSAVAVTPDGRRAVSGSGDRTLKVWDLRAGRAAGDPGGPWRWGHGGGGDAGRAARGLGLGRPDAQGLGPGAGRAAGDPGGPWRLGQGGGGDAGRPARGLGLGRPDAQGLGPGAGRAAGDPGGPRRLGSRRWR